VVTVSGIVTSVVVGAWYYHLMWSPFIIANGPTYCATFCNMVDTTYSLGVTFASKIGFVVGNTIRATVVYCYHIGVSFKIWS